MIDKITYYDILGISASASSEDVRTAHDMKVKTLERYFLSAGHSKVVRAASRALADLNDALSVVGDPIRRMSYDNEIGIRHGGGLAEPESVLSQPGLDFPNTGGAFETGAFEGVDPNVVLVGLAALADWLRPRPRRSRRVVVPDVRGMFGRQCRLAAAKTGLRVKVVQLTEYPVPIEGLVVDQSPQPGTKVRRSSTLTVAAWHPAVHPATRTQHEHRQDR